MGIISLTPFRINQISVICARYTRLNLYDITCESDSRPLDTTTRHRGDGGRHGRFNHPNLAFLLLNGRFSLLPRLVLRLDAPSVLAAFGRQRPGVTAARNGD